MNPNNLANTVSSLFYGQTPSEARNQKICLRCREKITVFRDELSKKEYDISGFCQKCQDTIFGDYPQ